jgi:hypothetical protein
MEASKRNIDCTCPQATLHMAEDNETGILGVDLASIEHKYFFEK